MHPEILRELGSQRGSEMRRRAQQAKLARMARRSRRVEQADMVVAPAIPDFVDGSFLADKTAEREPRRVQADRRAA
jgi:hypothetical protein